MTNETIKRLGDVLVKRLQQEYDATPEVRVFANYRAVAAYNVDGLSATIYDDLDFDAILNICIDDVLNGYKVDGVKGLERDARIFDYERDEKTDGYFPVGLSFDFISLTARRFYSTLYAAEQLSRVPSLNMTAPGLSFVTFVAK